jgi:hypothetical protein
MDKDAQGYMAASLRACAMLWLRAVSLPDLSRASDTSSSRHPPPLTTHPGPCRQDHIPRTALLVVDVQHDFVTGSLALSACKAGEVNMPLAAGRRQLHYSA